MVLRLLSDVEKNQVWHSNRMDFWTHVINDKPQSEDKGKVDLRIKSE